MANKYEIGQHILYLYGLQNQNEIFFGFNLLIILKQNYILL